MVVHSADNSDLVFFGVIGVIFLPLLRGRKSVLLVSLTVNFFSMLGKITLIKFNYIALYNDKILRMLIVTLTFKSKDLFLFLSKPLGGKSLEFYE